jgi:DNA-binding LacI/PurR family transcriptional regulator
MPTPKFTIRDVSKLAQVSITTVSNVLNGTGNISEPTRQRVLEAVKELGYVPDRHARSLKMNRSEMIELLFTHAEETMTSSRYFRDITASICAAASQRGYKVIVSVLSRKDPLQDQLNVIVRSGLVGGIILAGPSPEEVEVLNKTVGDFTAMIISSSSDQPQISYVDVDNTGGMLMAVSHLIELGHRQIAYLTPSEMDSHAYQRFQAYRQAMEMNGLKDEISIFTLYPGREEELIASVIAKQSTAVIAFDDLRALQLSTYFMREGISVPYDIALVGFDDEDFATHMAPPLTTLAQPFTEMGKAAAENLIARIEKPELPPTHLVLPLTLIVRASSGDGSKRE